MQKEVVQSSETPKPQSSYSQSILASAQRWLFISGQVPVNAEGKLVGKADIEVQTRQVFRNLQAQLKAAGATFDQVVKLTFFLRNISDYKTVARVREEFLKPDYPAATLVEISHLVNPEWLIEVEAIAGLD